MCAGQHEVLGFSGFLFHEFECLVERHSVLGVLGFTLLSREGMGMFSLLIFFYP